MNEPLDLALLRAYWSGDEVDPSQLPRQVWPDIRSLADEVERLRAESAGLKAAVSLAILPEVTSALDAAPPILSPDELHEAQASYRGAFESAKVVQPSRTGEDLLSEKRAVGKSESPAAGDQPRDSCPICQKYATGSAIHEADATIAALRAENTGRARNNALLSSEAAALRALVARNNAALEGAWDVMREWHDSTHGTGCRCPLTPVIASVRAAAQEGAV